MGRSARDRGDVAIAFGLALAMTAICLPLRAHVLINVDAVNFAFATEGFDLEHHEPHPPGYLGYVTVARGFSWLVGDANGGMTLLSAISAGVATALLYALARRMADRRGALIASGLFALAPLSLYYGTVALSYMPSAAVTLALVLACHRARFDNSDRAAYAAAALLAVLGATRQTDVLLMAPLVVFAFAGRTARVRWRSIALFGAVCLVWFVPLMLLSGGPLDYMGRSRELATYAGRRTSFFMFDAEGMMRNVELVGSATIAGVGVSIIPFVWAYRRGVLDRDTCRFFTAWVVPSLAVFLLIHTGQHGYMLPLLPVWYLALAKALADRARTGPVRLAPAPFAPALSLAMVGVLIAGSAAIYPFAPRVLVEHVDDGLELSIPAVADVHLPLDPNALPAIDVSAKDAHARRVITRVSSTDPDQTVVLTRSGAPTMTFRHLAYYLRDHVVYDIGPNLDGDFGHLFTGHEGRTDYRVDALDARDPDVRLDESVTEVLVFGFEPGDVHTTVPHRWERLDDQSRVMVLAVPAGSTLTIDGGVDAGLWLDSVPPGRPPRHVDAFQQVDVAVAPGPSN